MERLEILKTVTVLYVEDEYLLRVAIGRFLSRRCKEVILAANGKEGLELYKQRHIDIVITDLEMPVMNGFEMSKKILEITRLQPIIITTGYSDDEHIIAEACEHLIKPIDEDKLINAIIDCRNRRKIN
ncbi:response regulator receiver protein [Candidatus Magnetoovum chiemensis]|nr:response regulator receiver protein [Candidatus Magnetoovum chiemensis]